MNWHAQKHGPNQGGLLGIGGLLVFGLSEVVSKRLQINAQDADCPALRAN